ASSGPVPPRQGASAENQDGAVCVFCDQPVSKETYVAGHFGGKCVGGPGGAGRAEAERVIRSVREDARDRATSWTLANWGSPRLAAGTRWPASRRRSTADLDLQRAGPARSPHGSGISSWWQSRRLCDPRRISVAGKPPLWALRDWRLGREQRRPGASGSGPLS